MVKLDSSKMFVNDPVDVWGKEHTIGNAELAARLGSPITFDRRGTVFVYDGFEDSPLKWATSFGTGGGGSGHSITLSTENVYSGSGCVKIVLPSAADDYARMRRPFGGISQNNIGLEVNMLFDDTVNQKPSIFFSAQTGSRLVKAGIRIEQNSAEGLSYLQATDPTLDASWTSFNKDFVLDLDTPYPIKFVVDLENEKYVRCMFGGTEIDMSTLIPYAVASTSMQRIYTDVLIVANGATSPKTYVDNFILTIEEPA